ncbi:MAG: zinc-dependent metalloprotease, partial [Isosphaeraceae bacterium]
MRRLITLSGAAALLLAFGPLGVRGADEPKATSEPKAAPDAPDNLDIQSILSQARSGTSTTTSSGSEKKYKDFAEVTRGAEKIDGMFTLHRKDDHLYAEIKPQQFDQPLLMPITIAKGLAQVGIPVGESDMVLVFRKVGDRVQLVRRNIRFKAPAGTPLDKSVKQNYADSVLLALPIVSVNPAGGMSTLVDLSEIFLTNFAELPFGSMDRSRSNWHRVKGFPNNLELEVETTFSGGRSGLRGGDGVPDSRGITLVVHYSLMKAPDMGYKVRPADDRVGHFLDTQKDFGLSSPDSNYVRHINRWRLEKADPKAKLSPPKKQIVWWIEDTVPIEYRPYVEAGILEWNKAFEAVGIRSALAVRWQDGRDDFDPEDANYCTFRWVTSDAGFARSCFRTNPMTGEIIDGDVVFDASFIRHWKQEYALLVGSKGQGQGVEPLAIGEVISPIMAAKYQYGQLLAGTPRGIHAQADDPQRELIPADWGPLQYKLSKELARGESRFCGLHSGLSDDFGIAALALADAKKADVGDELPEDFIGQALKSVVMHEVGHSLGLRHNFKASTMLSADQLNDTAITHKKGLVGSVMDYAPVNIAPKGKTQGDYYTTTLGPYDYWAIEYAYKAIDGSEESELKKIASRAPEADLTYATDEDMSQNKDPQVNTWDLGSDPCQFAKERISLAARLLKDLDDKVVKDGESWARNRRAFSTLM